jgi:hypothetical protein
MRMSLCPVLDRTCLYADKGLVLRNPLKGKNLVAEWRAEVA